MISVFEGNQASITSKYLQWHLEFSEWLIWASWPPLTYCNTGGWFLIALADPEFSLDWFPTYIYQNYLGSLWQSQTLNVNQITLFFWRHWEDFSLDFFFFILKLFGVIFLDNFIPQGHLNPIYYVQVALLQRFVNITQEICIYIFFHNSSLQGRIWLRKKQKSLTYRTFQCFLTWKETEMQEEEDIAWDG